MLNKYNIYFAFHFQSLTSNLFSPIGPFHIRFTQLQLSCCHIFDIFPGKLHKSCCTARHPTGRATIFQPSSCGIYWAFQRFVPQLLLGPLLCSYVALHDITKMLITMLMTIQIGLQYASKAGISTSYFSQNLSFNSFFHFIFISF